MALQSHPVRSFGQATRINEEGYVARPVGSKGHKSNRKIIYRDWWLAKPHIHLHVNTLPQRYWGKRIRIKIEVVEGK
jgi:hypothetical protein